MGAPTPTGNQQTNCAARLDTVIEQLAIVVRDLQNTIVSVNRAAERILGKNERDVVGQTFTDVFGRLSMSKDSAGLCPQGMASGSVSYRKPDGSHILLSVVDYALPSISSETPSIVAVLYPLKSLDSEFTGDATVVSHEDFEVLAEHSTDIIARFDRQLRHLYVSPLIERVTGLPVTAFLGRTNEEMGMPKHLCDHWSSHIRAVFETRLEQRGEFEYEAVDGKRIFDFRIAPEFGLDGEVVSAVSITRDITDIRRSSDAEARLAAIVEYSEDAIIGKTLDGIVTSWNRGAERMYGYTAREAVGQHIAKLVAPENVLEIEEILAQLKQGLTVDSLETIRHTREGNTLYVSLTVSPIFDRYGNIVGASTIARDLTKQKIAEQRERELEEHKRDFYRQTIFAATEGKLMIMEAAQIVEMAGEVVQKWPIEQMDDIATLRNEITNFARETGFSESGMYALTGCVVEAAGNVLKHAIRGYATLHTPGDRVIVVIQDEGPGIGAMSLPDVALKKGYSTAGTLGMGYKVMLHLADRIYLATGTTGTTIAMEMDPRKDPDAAEGQIPPHMSGWTL